MVVPVLHSSPILEAGWLSWSGPRSIVIRLEGVRPLGWGHSVRLRGWYLVSDYGIHPRIGHSVIQTDVSLDALDWSEPGTAQSSVACVGP